MQLTNDNFMLYAAKYYDNYNCLNIEEFHNDLGIIVHLKKLFTRYCVNGVLKSRLIINHLISFFNVWNPLAAIQILFFKIEPKYHSYLKTSLIFINRWTDTIFKNVAIDDILMQKFHEMESNGANT